MSGLLNGPQSLQFADVLVSAYMTSQKLDRLLLFLGQPAVNLQATMNATFPEAALGIVLNANREGWAPSLLKAVAAGVPENPEVQQFFATYRELDPARNPQIANPWMAYRLYGGRLFMGRMQVRKQLRKMDLPLYRKVLVVQSNQRQVGKTYTGALVDLVSEQSGHHVAYIDLDSKEYTLQMVAEELALKWEIAPEQLPRQGGEQETRWAVQLGLFLVSNAPAKDGLVRWLILDGFRERVPSVGMKALIDELAVSIQDKRLFRMIVGNYSEPLPANLLSYVDIVVPLTLPEIQTALTAIHESLCGQAASAEEIADYMDAYAARLAEYKQRSPEHAESHLLIHNAAADVVEQML
jgi:hypothetical protein